MWADRPLALSRRQVRALLYRLAAGRQPIPREQLCYLLWPDTPEAVTRRYLTGLLSHLRRALPALDVLITSGDLVGLDPDRTWSDTVVFERLCTAQGPPAHLETLQQAVDLYRGPFLAGFSLPGCPEFETWATAERQTWERLYLETLATLIEEQAARGEHAAAIAYARRYVATDDLAEDIHRRLIELYAASGDRGADRRAQRRGIGQRWPAGYREPISDLAQYSLESVIPVIVPFVAQAAERAAKLHNRSG